MKSIKERHMDQLEDYVRTLYREPRLHASETEPEWESRELLTGLADCLPEGCFDQRFLD